MTHGQTQTHISFSFLSVPIAQIDVGACDLWLREVLPRDIFFSRGVLFQGQALPVRYHPSRSVDGASSYGSWGLCWYDPFLVGSSLRLPVIRY